VRVAFRIRLLALLVLASLAVGATAAGVASAQGLIPGLQQLFPPPPPPPPADPPSVGLPASGPAPAGEEPAAEDPDTLQARQPCFGAAARDPEHPCQNADLRYEVVPNPADPKSAQKYETCTSVETTPILKACFWGAPADRATRMIALVGDSHASHWRAAMQTVANAKGWRGVSIQRAGCPLTAAHPDLPGEERQQGCIAWNQAVQRWIAAHPEIDTVFTSAHLAKVIPPAGKSMSAARRDGLTAAYRRLLGGAVRHIVVIRGTPRISGQTIPCVERALQEMVQPPGEACALPIAYALRSDPLVAAARSMHTSKVQIADLHDFMCDAARCYPVVGGVLVLRDVSHMTTTFSTSLGPYLLERVNRLSAGWQPSTAPAR
jgi:hypothetical protein